MGPIPPHSSNTGEKKVFQNMVISSYHFYILTSPMRKAEHFRNQLVTQEIEGESQLDKHSDGHVHSLFHCDPRSVQDALVSSDKVSFLTEPIYAPIIPHYWNPEDIHYLRACNILHG